MLLLNSLEDRDNPKRVIFSVDKLNEGWDVLNLFDIVRLKNKASQKDTTKDAQLIGRGARYYPFSYNDFKPGRIEFYQRKFDLFNPLSALERLDYHAIYDSEFIAKLNNELQDLGLGFINEKQTIPLTPTKRFKCYYASNKREKITTCSIKTIQTLLKSNSKVCMSPYLALLCVKRKWILKKKIKAIELIIYPTP